MWSYALWQTCFDHLPSQHNLSMQLRSSNEEIWSYFLVGKYLFLYWIYMKIIQNISISGIPGISTMRGMALFLLSPLPIILLSPPAVFPPFPLPFPSLPTLPYMGECCMFSGEPGQSVSENVYCCRPTLRLEWCICKEQHYSEWILWQLVVKNYSCKTVWYFAGSSVHATKSVGK